MPLKQITFSKKYPYAQFLNYDIGYVWELSEGETREQIEAMLLKFADDTHKKNHPHLYQEQEPTTYNYIPIVKGDFVDASKMSFQQGTRVVSNNNVSSIDEILPLTEELKQQFLNHYKYKKEQKNQPSFLTRTQPIHF